MEGGRDVKVDNYCVSSKICCLVEIVFVFHIFYSLISFWNWVPISLPPPQLPLVDHIFSVYSARYPEL